MSNVEGAGTIAIVTDSTSDLPAELRDQYGITVVPLNVTIEGETWLDGVMTQQEFFDRMGAAANLPTTSQPSVGSFVDVYTEVLKTASHVISVHISSELSGTIASAHAAAERFAGKVSVFDSRNLSGGLGFVVIETARAAFEGLSVDDVLARAEQARDRVQMIVGLDNLDNLVKGGRVGRVAAFMGSMLNLKVTLTVKDGAFEPVARTRGGKAALDHTVNWCAERMGDASRGAFCVMHALAEDRAEWLAETLRERFEITELYTVPTGSVIATHIGTGWGVAFLPER